MSGVASEVAALVHPLREELRGPVGREDDVSRRRVEGEVELVALACGARDVELARRGLIDSAEQKKKNRIQILA